MQGIDDDDRAPAACLATDVREDAAVEIADLGARPLASEVAGVVLPGLVGGAATGPAGDPQAQPLERRLRATSAISDLDDDEPRVEGVDGLRSRGIRVVDALRGESLTDADPRAGLGGVGGDRPAIDGHARVGDGERRGEHSLQMLAPHSGWGGTAARKPRPRGAPAMRGA